jgi:hypothetical protein
MLVCQVVVELILVCRVVVELILALQVVVELFLVCQVIVELILLRSLPSSFLQGGKQSGMILRGVFLVRL